LVRQDAQGFAFIMLFLQSGQKFLSRFVVAQAQRGGFRKGPLEGRVPDCLARGAPAFATRFLAAFDQAARRSEVLHAGTAADVMHVIQPHEAENLATAGHGLQQVQGMGIMLLGSLDDGEFKIATPLVVIADEGKSDGNIFLYCGVGKACSDPVAIGFVGVLWASILSFLALPPWMAFIERA
jgi:hypothetical protein